MCDHFDVIRYVTKLPQNFPQQVITLRIVWNGTIWMLGIQTNVPSFVVGTGICQYLVAGIEAQILQGRILHELGKVW